MYPKISINMASAEEIAELRGIGPRLATRIVEFRETEGFFSGPEDLARVKGISHQFAATLASQIDWNPPEEEGPVDGRQYFAAIRLTALAAVLAVISVPDIAALLDTLEFWRLGVGPPWRELVVQIGASVGIAIAALACALLAVSSIVEKYRPKVVLHRAAYICLALGCVLILIGALRLVVYDLQSGDYKADPTARFRVLTFLLAVLMLLPQVIAFWRPRSVGPKLLLYWLNCCFLVLLGVVTLQTYSVVEAPSIRFSLVAIFVIVAGRMIWGLLAGDPLTRPLDRADFIRLSPHHPRRFGSPSRPPSGKRVEQTATLVIGSGLAALAAALTLANEGARLLPLGLVLLFAALVTYSAWRYATKARLTGDSLLAVAAAIVLLFAVAKVASSNNIPRFEASFDGSVDPASETRELWDFLSGHEGRRVYLGLGIEPGMYVQADGLFPRKTSDPATLILWESCAPPPEDERERYKKCDNISLSIQADPQVESHIHYTTPALLSIDGYFIVEEIVTAMDVSEAYLKPLSIKDVGFDASGRHI